MTDTAPERISISPVHRKKREDDFYLVDRRAFPGKGTEYIRADLHEVEVKRLRAIELAAAKFVSASDALNETPVDRGGKNGPRGLAQSKLWRAEYDLRRALEAASEANKEPSE